MEGEFDRETQDDGWGPGLQEILGEQLTLVVQALESTTAPDRVGKD